MNNENREINKETFEFKNMTRNELIKHISYLQTKINLQKAIIDDMPEGSMIGYAVMAMSNLGFDKESIEKVKGTIYGMLKEKTKEEAETFYRNNFMQ